MGEVMQMNGVRERLQRMTDEHGTVGVEAAGLLLCDFLGHEIADDEVAESGYTVFALRTLYSSYGLYPEDLMEQYWFLR